MEYRLTESEKKDLEERIARWVPYSKEEFDAIPYDAEPDWGRLAATFAKMALEADEEDNGTS